MRLTPRSELRTGLALSAGVLVLLAGGYTLGRWDGAGAAAARGGRARRVVWIDAAGCRARAIPLGLDPPRASVSTESGRG